VRRAAAVLGAVVALGTAYLGVTALQVWLTSRHIDRHRSQAIVVMGAAQYDGRPSPDLAARLGQARRLWAEGDAPVVVVTGSKEPGDAFTEAQAGAAWLGANGVPAADVIEAGGNDSWSNLADAASALHARDVDDVLVVTDGFHEDRSLAIAADVGLVASPVPATASPITGWAALPYFAKETVGVAIGRIIGYRPLHALGERAAMASRVD